MAEFNCRSVFCVINNPEWNITYKHNERGDIIKGENGEPEILEKEATEYNGKTPEQICNDVLNKWIADGDTHSGWVGYCISALGLEHLHCVFESSKTFRPLSVLKRLFPKIHIEPTKGNKKDVEDYVNKRGKFEEKGEKVIASAQVGEIIGKQGSRSDLLKLDEIKRLIFEENKTPRELFFEYPQALKSERAVKWFYYEKRRQETPLERSVYVVWLCGRTGCGKSHTYVRLCEEHGEDNVYRVSDYTNPFDNYMGQDIVFFDEFRGQFRLADFLMYLDKYRQELRARYSNNYALWTKVYISSPVTPYELYNKDGDTKGSNDKLQQLYRRIDEIRYCFKVSDDDYTYYCQQRFPCDLDNYPERIYQQFFKARNNCQRLLNLYCTPPEPSDGFEVTKVIKTEQEKQEDERQAELYGIEF